MTVIVESDSLAAVHIDILAVIIVTFITRERKLISRLLREEGAELGSCIRILRHALPLTSETANTPLTVLGDRSMRPSARNASLSSTRIPADDLNIVYLFGHFEPFFVEKCHMRHLFWFLNFFLW